MNITLITHEILAMWPNRRVEVILRLNGRQSAPQCTPCRRVNTYRLMKSSLCRIECSTKRSCGCGRVLGVRIGRDSAVACSQGGRGSDKRVI